eukprot:3185975-Pleurochrysis_carterae.AAC.1
MDKAVWDGQADSSRPPIRHGRSEYFSSAVNLVVRSHLRICLRVGQGQSAFRGKGEGRFGCARAAPGGGARRWRRGGASRGGRQGARGAAATAP